MWIGYTTPTPGLGCRATTYLLYGIIATTVWFLHVMAMLLSHEVMLRSQQSNDEGVKRSTDAWPYQVLCAFTVLCRCAGKILAVFNTLLLISSSILEPIGAYDNCWCNGDVIGDGYSGYITLFRSGKDLRLAARLPWGGGLALAIFVTFIYLAFAVSHVVAEDD